MEESPAPSWRISRMNDHRVFNVFRRFGGISSINRIFRIYFLHCMVFIRKYPIWVSPKIRGTPKWMVKIMENPIKRDDFAVKPTIFGNIHIIYTHPGCRFCTANHYLTSPVDDFQVGTDELCAGETTPNNKNRCRGKMAGLKMVEFPMNYCRGGLGVFV